MVVLPDSDLRQFVEDMGRHYEEEGFPPMAGRLAAWLLVCDPPQQTAAQLAGVLGASAGSISTMTRLLVQFGLVERVGVPGQRSASFRIRDGAAAAILTAHLDRARRMRHLLERGRKLLAGASPARRKRLRAQLDFHAFVEREIPAILARWAEERRP